MNDKQENSKLGDLAAELIVLHKSIFNKFLKTKYPAELMGLYSFYYYTAKWQETNQIKCNDLYIKKCLKWGITKIKKLQKILVIEGLIEHIQRRDDKGKITGWYVKINFIFRKETLNSLNHNTQKQQVDNTTSGKQDTIALSTDNINALSSDIKKRKQRVPDIVLGEYENVKLTQTEYENFKNKYPDIYKDCIEKLSSFIATKTKDPYSNHRAAMDSWVISAVKKDNNVSKQYKNSARQKDEMLIKSIQRSAENDRKRLQNSGGKDVRAIANSLLGHNFGMLDTSNNGTS